MDLVEDFVTFGSQQVSLVFGENSALSKLILGGFGPLVENIDNIFAALESLINFKRNMLDTFLSENYDRDKLLREVLSKKLTLTLTESRLYSRTVTPLGAGESFNDDIFLLLSSLFGEI